MPSPRSALAVAIVAGLAAPALAQPIAASIVAIEGQDAGDGLTYTAFGDVYVNTLGQPGFVYTRSDSTTKRGIWIGAGSAWHSDQILPDTASGGEPTIGISDAGDFIYSPAFNGQDAVVTSHGKLLAEGDVIPNLPNLVSRFNSRPRMAANGTAFWVGGINEGGLNVGNAFFKATNTADPNTITAIFRTGDLVDGRPISSLTSIFNYDVSDDAAHWISSVGRTGTTADDAIILVDLTNVVAREGQPTGQGDNWANFDDPVINTAGNHAFTGDTDSLTTAADGYIAYNGQIVLREGATVGGTVLAGNPSDIAIDNNNRIAFVWGPQTTGTNPDRRRALYIGSGPDLAATAVKLLQLDQQVDVNDDGIADYTVSDFNIGAGPGMDLADSGPVYISVNLVAIGGVDELETIIAIAAPGGEPPCPADWNDDGAVNSSDISAFLTSWLDSIQNGNLIADFNGDDAVNSTDISAFLTQWLDDVAGGEC